MVNPTTTIERDGTEIQFTENCVWLKGNGEMSVEAISAFYRRMARSL